MADLKKALAESFPVFITKEKKLEFGYIAPQLQWIADDSDLQDTYC